MEFNLIDRFHSLLLMVDMKRHQIDYFGKHFEVFHVQPYIFMVSNIHTVLLSPVDRKGLNWWSAQVTRNEDLSKVDKYVDDFTKEVNVAELIAQVCDIDNNYSK